MHKITLVYIYAGIASAAFCFTLVWNIVASIINYKRGKLPNLKGCKKIFIYSLKLFFNALFYSIIWLLLLILLLLPPLYYLIKEITKKREK